MPSDSFYTKLSPFRKFVDFTKDAFYAPLPEDWCIVISDIEGSTRAIEAGNYKDVNLVGAATIVAARNALSGHSIPFVFGGDGASFAFHRQHQSQIEEAMRGLQRMAAENFGLTLRIGRVEVSKLYAAGAKLEVARYELIAGRHLAVFRGGGLSLAEKWIKEPASTYLIEAKAVGTADLNGLSCRWNAIPNIRGTVASLIIQKKDDAPDSIYEAILERLSVLCGGDLEAVNPVNVPAATYQSIRECLFQENRLHLPKWSYTHLYRILEIVVCVCIFRFRVPPLFMDPDRYTKSMRTHADYRKFDDVLRMVIDISREQLEAITQYLESLRNEGHIYYGLHRSSDSLMTCYVDDVHEGNHVHFIDGADGGYAIAAKQLKAQTQQDLIPTSQT